MSFYFVFHQCNTLRHSVNLHEVYYYSFNPLLLTRMSQSLLQNSNIKLGWNSFSTFVNVKCARTDGRTQYVSLNITAVIASAPFYAWSFNPIFRIEPTHRATCKNKFVTNNCFDVQLVLNKMANEYINSGLEICKYISCLFVTIMR